MGLLSFLTHFPKRTKAGWQYLPEHGDSLGDAAGNADGWVEVSTGHRQKRMAESEDAKTWKCGVLSQIGGWMMDPAEKEECKPVEEKNCRKHCGEEGQR